jgi:hypothetical protein
MSAVAGAVFVRYHGARRRRSSMTSSACSEVAYQRVSKLWQTRPKGDRPPYCLFGPVARLTDAGDLRGLLEGHFDGPAGSVPFDDLRGRREQIGGDQCDVVAAGTALTDQNQSNRLGAEGQVPEQLTMGDLDGGHGAVPGHRPLPQWSVAARSTVTDLRAAIDRFLRGWNQQFRPFSWVKSADEILAKASRPRITESVD